MGSWCPASPLNPFIDVLAFRAPPATHYHAMSPNCTVSEGIREHSESGQTPVTRRMSMEGGRQCSATPKEPQEPPEARWCRCTKAMPPLTRQDQRDTPGPLVAAISQLSVILLPLFPCFLLLLLLSYQLSLKAESNKG